MLKENKIKVLVLKAEKEALELREVVTSDTLSFLQKTVGGTVDVLRLGDIDVWVNDECLLLDLPLNFYVGSVKHKEITHKIAGDVVFASHNSEGETIGLTPEQVTKVQMMFAERRLVIGDMFL